MAIVEGRVAIEIDTAIYGLDAILRAGYKFTDRCYVFIDRPAKRSDRVVVFLAHKTDAASLEADVGEFCNELLDQQVRQSLAREFGGIRTLIVAQAFSEGNLLDTQRDDGDYQTDPQGTLQRR